MLGVYAQPLALSVPRSPFLNPFLMFINGNEIGSVGAIAKSIKVSDPGVTGVAELSFTIEDHNNLIAPWIAANQRVLWYAVNSLTNPDASFEVLFQGFISHQQIRPVGPASEIDVTVVHISSVLDKSQPITSVDVGPCGNVMSAIQSLLGNFCTEPNLGSGGISATWASVTLPASLPLSNVLTLRQAMDQVIAAGHGWSYIGVVGYAVNNLGKVYGTLPVASGHEIDDALPTGSVVSAVITADQNASTWVDALYVTGGASVATGPIYSWQCGFTNVPSSPLRWGTLSAPQALTAAAAISAASEEFAKRQATTIYTAVVDGRLFSSAPGYVNYVALRDGGIDTGSEGFGRYWTLNSKALGVSGVSAPLVARSYQILSGKGDFRATLTFGNVPPSGLARTRQLIEQATPPPLTGVTSFPAAPNPNVPVFRADLNEWYVAGATAGTWYPIPGGLIDYVETSTLTSITASTEATATTFVTGNAKTYDGATKVRIEAFTPFLQPDSTAGAQVNVVLYDGASSIGILGQVVNSAASAYEAPALMVRELTPSAGSHTYSIRAYRPVGGNATMGAGTGGASAWMPGYIRITRV